MSTARRSSVGTNNLAIPAANAPLTIGQAEGFFMQGLMDEISIYDRALTAGEIASIYEAGAVGKGQAEQLLTIGPAGFNSSGQFQFQILGGQVGATIQVQASSDLAHWTNVWQTVNTNGVAILYRPEHHPQLPALLSRHFKPMKTSINPSVATAQRNNLTADFTDWKWFRTRRPLSVSSAPSW